MLVFGGLGIIYWLRAQPLGLDFFPVWAAAANPSSAYDGAALTQFQSDNIATNWTERPFAYPPTALLLFLPLGILSPWLSYAMFTASAFAAFAFFVTRLNAPWWTVLTPPMIMLVHVGQATLLVGALIFAAFGKSSPLLRGFLLALAGVIKPQLCLFLPLLLLREREFLALMAGAVAALSVAAIATLFFGASFWLDWLEQAKDLPRIVAAHKGLSADSFQGSIFLLPLALAAMWLTRNSDILVRVGTAIGSVLLISPYAMNYEIALLMPGLAAAIRQKWQMVIPTILVGTWFWIFEFTSLLLGMVALVAFAILTESDRRRTSHVPESAKGV